MIDTQPHAASTDNAVMEETFGNSVVPGSARYWATHFSQQHVRPRTQAIFCFAHLMDELALASPEVVREKSLWWHEELQRFAAQQPRHPVLQALLRLQPGTPEKSGLAAALHDHLHGALSTQQKMAVSDQDGWQQYAQLRLGSLHTLLGLAAEVPAADAADFGRWAGNLGMLGVMRTPELFNDGRWTVPAFAERAPASTAAEELHALLDMRPGHGAAASEVLIALDVHWWHRDATASSPLYSNAPLGVGGLFRSWRAARTTPYS